MALDDPSAPSDFQMPDYGNEMPNALSGQMTLQNDPISTLRGFQSQSVAQSKANQQPQQPKQIIIHDDGTMDFKGMPKQAVEMHAQALAQMNEIRGAFAQEDARLRQREDFQRKHPVAQLLTTLASNLGQSPDMPGWVQGAARTNAALNPTADQLQQKRMALLKERAGVEHQYAASVMEGERMKMDSERLRLEQARMGDLRDERKQNNWEQLRKSYEDPATQHGVTKDKDEFYREGLALGKSLSDVDGAWKNIETLAEKRDTQKREDAQRDADKAVQIAKATAPVKIQVGETLQDHASQNRREEMKIRNDLKLETEKKIAPLKWDARTKGMFENMLNRMEVTRLKGLGELSQSDFKDIENVTTMRSFADRMYRLFGPGGKLSGYTGRWEGILTSKLASSLSSSERQTVQHMFMVERKRLIDWGKAGVMGWRPSEDTIKKLGLIETLTPEAMANIYKEINAQLDMQLRSKTKERPFAPWDKMPEVFGGVDSPLYADAAKRSNEFYANVEDIRQRGEARLAGQPVEQPGSPSFDDFRKWKAGRE